MKRLNYSIALLVFISSVFTSCIKDPGEPVLMVSKAVVAVDEEVTFTLEGVENYTCIFIGTSSGADFTAVSGGGTTDKSMTVKFSSTGTFEFMATVKNCRGDDDPCIGNCRDEYAYVSITVE